MRRVIAHMDVDAFYASVELLRRPELRGKPVVVSGRGPRAVVTTASYEARAYGVHSAIPTSRALRLCPQAIVIPPDFDAYRAESKRVWEIVRAEVDLVEQLGLDEAYLDLSETAAPKALMRALVAQVREHTGLTASVGIGPNKLVAKVASDCEKPAGLVALSREMACERFADSPPRLLPGIGPKTAERLDAMGLRTLRDVRSAEVALLVDKFGEHHGTFIHRRAHFHDDAPLESSRVAVSRSTETTFDEDIADPAELERVLTRLADELCGALRHRAVVGRTIAIKVRLSDFTTVTRARTVAEATNDAALVAAVACDLLRAYAPPKPVRLLGVRLASLSDAAEDNVPQLALPL